MSDQFKLYRCMIDTDGHEFAFDCWATTKLEAQYQALAAYSDATVSWPVTWGE
jgi:hypothetical protein